MLGIGSGKRRIAAEAGLKTTIRSRDPLTDEITGMKQTAFLQIIMNGTACFLFEQAHHVEFTDKEFLCQKIDGKILCQVGIDLAQNIQNPAVRGVMGVEKVVLGSRMLRAISMSRRNKRPLLKITLP